MNDDRYGGVHYVVQRAIGVGALIRRPCQCCGAGEVVAHHDDYSKPLDVTWLCRKCHQHRHVELRGGSMETAISLRLPNWLVARIDAWRASQPDLPGRQQVARIALERFLENTPVPPRKRGTSRAE